MKKLGQLSKIILYDDPSTSNFKLTEIKNYLISKLSKVEVEVRDNFLTYFLNQNYPAKLINSEKEVKDKEISQISQSSITEVARRLAKAKIRNIMDPTIVFKPLRGEITFEKKSLNNPENIIPGIFYDGFKLHGIFQKLLPTEEINGAICHIIFTPRLFGTFDKSDRRYHARVILCGYPSIISTSGVVDAPAKPKEYYRIKQELLMQNITTIDEFVPEELRNQYLKYNDPRLTEVLNGYVLQAIFYHLTAEPFCEDSKCRLFNAHWQKQVLDAQLSEPEFCKKHNELLNIFNQNKTE